MQNRRNYYRILQVQPDAPFEVIRGSYRTLLKELRMHPDLGGDHWNAQTLNQAYEILSDPDSRAEYDRRLFEEYTKRTGGEDGAGKRPLATVFCPFCGRSLGRVADAEGSCDTCSSPLRRQEEPSAGQECRRVLDRAARSGTMVYHVDWPEPGRVGTLLDLSPSGLRFRCADEIPTGWTLKVGSDDFDGVCTIAHTTPIRTDPDPLHEIGGPFVTVRFRRPRGVFFSASI